MQTGEQIPDNPPSPSIFRTFGRKLPGCRLQSEICLAFRDLLSGLKSAQLSRYCPGCAVSRSLENRLTETVSSRTRTRLLETLAFHRSDFCFLQSALDRLVAAKAGADAHRHHDRLIGFLGSRPPDCGDKFGRIRQPWTLRCSNLSRHGASVCRSIRPGAEGLDDRIVSEKVA